jgi:hypothetical protein
MSEPVNPPAPDLPAGPVVSASALNSNFKLIFITVALLTVALLIVWVALSLAIANPAGNAQTMISGVGILANAGVGAMFGLVGGKVTN